MAKVPVLYPNYISKPEIIGTISLIILNVMMYVGVLALGMMRVRK